MKHINNLTIDTKTELELTEVISTQVSALLKHAFPEDYVTNRPYYKQLPQARLLAYVDAILVGHMGVDHRVVNADGSLIEILGITDLCVHAHYRSRGIATQLLNELQIMARNHNVSTLIAFANDPRLYERNGFKICPAICKFLAIDIQNEKRHSHSIIERQEPSLKLHSEQNPKHIDFLGHIF